MTVLAPGKLALLAPLLLASVGLGSPEEDRTEQSDIRARVQRARRELWRAGIDAPKDSGDGEKLRKAVLELRKVGKGPVRPDAAPVPHTPTVPASQPAPAPASQPATHPVAPQTPAPSTDDRKISLVTLERLRKLSPRSVHNPISLGNSLFRGGRLEEAAQIYQIAMQRSPSKEDLAWMLFHMGNCKRESDRQTAADHYDTLIREHPSSQWTAVAQIQKHLIEWRMVNDPGRILKVLKADAERRTRRRGPQPSTPVSAEKTESAANTTE